MWDDKLPLEIIQALPVCDVSRIEDEVIISQNIQVDRSRTVPVRGNTADCRLDMLKEFEKSYGLDIGMYLYAAQ